MAAFFALRRRGPVKSDERVRLLYLGKKPLKCGLKNKVRDVIMWRVYPSPQIQVLSLHQWVLIMRSWMLLYKRRLEKIEGIIDNSYYWYHHNKIIFLFKSTECHSDWHVFFQRPLYRFEGSSSAISMNAYIRERRQECIAGTAVCMSFSLRRENGWCTHQLIVGVWFPFRMKMMMTHMVSHFTPPSHNCCVSPTPGT